MLFQEPHSHPNNSNKRIPSLQQKKKQLMKSKPPHILFPKNYRMEIKRVINSVIDLEES